DRSAGERSDSERRSPTCLETSSGTGAPRSGAHDEAPRCPLVSYREALTHLGKNFCNLWGSDPRERRGDAPSPAPRPCQFRNNQRSEEGMTGMLRLTVSYNAARRNALLRKAAGLIPVGVTLGGLLAGGVAFAQPAPKPTAEQPAAPVPPSTPPGQPGPAQP